MVNDGRLRFQGRQFRAEVLGLRGSTAKEKTNAHLPGLAILTGPMANADRTVGRVLAKRPFWNDVLQTPRANLHTMLVADLQK